jgi:hypothetical protein
LTSQSDAAVYNKRRAAYGAPFCIPSSTVGWNKTTCYFSDRFAFASCPGRDPAAVSAARSAAVRFVAVPLAVAERPAVAEQAGHFPAAAQIDAGGRCRH